MSLALDARDVVRHRLRVTGLVQGVGFRPFAHRLADALDLSGAVGNDEGGVWLEVEGPRAAVETFQARLVTEAPPLARIRRIEPTTVASTGEQGFRIAESTSGPVPTTSVAPDAAVCADCLAELSDPAERRYRYPFTNCTNCGPRFTITCALPYDRPHTTMERFAMCADCAREYHDPSDRRFHAQPIACPACGPQLRFDGPGTGCSVAGTDTALAAAQRALAAGQIVAVKGVGGYHLACDATCAPAVAELRRRKHRPDKPMAVMVRDLEAAEEVAEMDDAEAALLVGPGAPIVLLRRRRVTALADQVVPGAPHVGVLLPYTPLHHLLLRPIPGAVGPVPEMLVMTSANLSDEPICHQFAEARRRLAGIADGWLEHDRPIHVPCDDSVVRVSAGEVHLVRRSRGYAPLPVVLPFRVPPVLAVGAERKNVFCIARGTDAWMSQHIGDMGSPETLEAFERSVRQLTEIYGVQPRTMAADMHPGYHTRRWAEDHDLPVVLVQHHHAHAVSLMVERGLSEDSQVLAVAFDGTGYGTDGTIWGGEVLLAGYGSCERLAHLHVVPLPGGDAAIRRPYRAALAHLWAAGIEWAGDLCPVQAAAGERDALASMLASGVGCTPTSSMGRLFDAVSSLLGVRHTVSYEGQAAIALEALANRAVRRIGDGPRGRGRYRFALLGDAIDPAPALRAIVADVRSGRGAAEIAAGFHLAVARMIADVGSTLAERTGVRQVGLTGGVFQNVLLVELARQELRRCGLEVLTHRLLPPNDGGLALGQAVIAGYGAGAPGRAA